MSNNQLIPFTDIQQTALTVLKSGLFPALRSPEEVITLMLIAQAEGRHIMEAVSRYHIINGRPSKTAAAIMADYQASGGKIKVLQRSEKAAQAIFSHPCCPDPVDILWSYEMAVKAGLTGKGTWKQYPRQMLWARVISEGVRATYPAATGLLYTPEEVEDFHNEQQPTDKTTVLEAEILPPQPKPTPPPKPAARIQPPAPQPIPEAVQAVIETQTAAAITAAQEANRDYNETLTADVMRQIIRLMPPDKYAAAESVIKDRAKRKPIETLQYAVKVYGPEYFRKYLHAAKTAAGCTDEKYRAILASHNLHHSTEIISVDTADAIVEEMNR